MAVTADKTIELHHEYMGANEIIYGGVFDQILQRNNGDRELVDDTACPGAGGRTYRGHDHVSADLGRGIPMGRMGKIILSGPPLQLSWATKVPRSMAYGSSSDYEPSAGTWTGLNYVMGVCHISPNISAVLVELCCYASSLDYEPMIRVKNLTDTDTQSDGRVIASDWIKIQGTTPHWYGSSFSDPAEKIIVPIDVSTSIKRVELDIEIMPNKDSSTNTEYSVYGAMPYQIHVQE